MSKFGENIYERKDGRWVCRVLKPDGKHRYLYGQSYDEVQNKKEKLMKAFLSLPETSPNSRHPLSCLLKKWLNDDVRERVKPTTYDSYYYCMATYVIPFFDSLEIGGGAISEGHIKYFISYISRNQHLSETYKRKVLSIFKTALKKIFKNAENYRSIMEAFHLPKSKSVPVAVFSMKEQRLIEAEIMRDNDIRSVGILLCFYTGIRLGELCALSWKDVDLDAKTLLINGTVSRIKKRIPNTEKLNFQLLLRKAAVLCVKSPYPIFDSKDAIFRKLSIERGFLYFSNKKGPTDPRTYQRVYKRLLDKAKITPRKFHAIRHTFATRALEMSVDIKTLSELLGHSSVTVTLNTYAHSLMEQKIIAIDKMNSFYEKQWISAM